MKPVYKFLLRVGSVTATATEVHPVWKDDLALDYARESQQMFFRAQLSGSIDLIRGDYDLVMAEAFGTVFYLDIQISDSGISYTHYWRGRFTLTDCKVNADDKVLTVKPEVVDQYTDILAGLEKEFDLIKLQPAIEKILIRKRPCLQIYDEGDEIISCIFGNISFEQDASVPSDEENLEEFLRERCHFAVISSFAEFNFTEIATGFENDFHLPFSGVMNGDGSEFRNTTNTYYLRYFQYRNALPNYQYEYFNGIEIYQTGDVPSGNNWKWRFQQSYVGSYNSDYPALPVEIGFVKASTTTVDMKAVRTSQTVYSRIVCNVENLGNGETYQLFSDDVTYNRNYRRAYPYAVSIVQSSRSTSTPTQWGRMDDGYYFLPPDDTDGWVPVGRSKWVNTSLWYKLTTDWLHMEQMATYAYMMNDAYPLWSCITALLSEIAPNILFAGTSVYSNFLYSGADAIAGRDNRLYITPKSNITAGEYQTPAQTAMVTLKDILNMLRNTYQLYWFIDSNNRLRIEHIYYFENGGSYSGSPSVGYDLTTLGNKRNGKKWAYGTNVYEYDKPDMPERYQFAWMDEVTDLFRGNPIEIVSQFVQMGKVEEINVANFTSDVDFMLLNPSAISPDGFALMGVTDANAIIGVAVRYTAGEIGDVISVASYVMGKTCVLRMSTYGTGTVTLIWWKGREMVTSSYTYSVGAYEADYVVVVPDGVTGLSFDASDGATILFVSLKVQYDTSTLQLPMNTLWHGGAFVQLQNSLLSYSYLQNPYWKYNMPAKSIKIDNVAETAVTVQKGRKQMVNIPLTLTDPNVLLLVTTGLGNGQIRQMSIRLTSRMAKTELRYDTE